MDLIRQELHAQIRRDKLLRKRLPKWTGDRQRSTIRWRLDYTVYLEFYDEFPVEVGALGALRNRLYVAHRGLVGLLVKKRSQYASTDDLMQQGLVGLAKGIDRFDVTKGFAFSTYGLHWIRHSVNRWLDDNIRTIRLPVHLREKISKDKLSDDDKWRIYASSTYALSEDIDCADHESNTEALFNTDEHHHRLREEIAKIRSERTRRIVERYYGLETGESMTLEKAGSPFGITRERTRQILTAELQILAHKLADLR